MTTTNRHRAAATFILPNGKIVDSPYLFFSEFGAFLVTQLSNYFQMFPSRDIATSCPAKGADATTNAARAGTADRRRDLNVPARERQGGGRDVER